MGNFHPNLIAQETILVCLFLIRALRYYTAFLLRRQRSNLIVLRTLEEMKRGLLSFQTYLNRANITHSTEHLRSNIKKYVIKKNVNFRFKTAEIKDTHSHG